MADNDTNRIPVNQKLLTRFFSRIRIDPAITFNGSPCWIWTGGVTDGYGQFFFDGMNQNAHRIAFEMFDHIMAPRKNQGDHLCRNKICANPAHIEEVTPRVNSLRGNNRSAQNARKTHCIHGHEFTKENTRYYGPDKRFRECHTCRRGYYRKIGYLKIQCRKGHPYDGPPMKDGHRCRVCRAVAEAKRKLVRRKHPIP